MPIVIAIYIFTGVCVLCIECHRLVCDRRISFASFCFTFFAIFCCIVPGLTLWYGDLSRCRNHSEWYAFITYILTFAVYIFLYLGYNLGDSKHQSKYLVLQIHNKHYGNSNIILYASVLLLISIISLLIYSSGYGGILQTMLLGGQIRGSFIQSSNSYAFFKHLIPLSIISSLLIYTNLFIFYKKSYLFIKYCLFILSFIVSIVYIAANDGRLLAGIYILLFIIINIKYKYEKLHVSIKKIAFTSLFVSILIFTLIIGSEYILNSFRGYEGSTTDQSVFDVILSEFNFVYVGLYTAIINILEYDSAFLLLNDITNGLFAWFPTSIKPIIMDDVWDINTALINDGGYGQSPVNIVGQSFYDLGFIGICIIPFIYAFILGRLNVFFKNDLSTIGLVFFSVTAFYLGKSMVYFSLYNIMMNIFFIVLSWFLYKILFSKVLNK